MCPTLIPCLVPRQVSTVHVEGLFGVCVYVCVCGFVCGVAGCFISDISNNCKLQLHIE